MSINYKDVLNRLMEERERMSWSQREICQHMYMGQAQYCKIENGEQYFSFAEVKILSEIGMDVHYIFTGQKGNSIYTKQFEACNYREAVCLLDIIFSIVTRHYVLGDTAIWKELYKEIQFVRLLDANVGFDNNLFFLLRCLLAYTQKEMAVIFGIDIKKVRRLERGQCMPDSELLWQCYKKFRIPPSILLKDSKGLLNGAGWLLERIDSELEDDVLMAVEAFQKIS